MESLIRHLLHNLANSPLTKGCPLYNAYEKAYRSVELENCTLEMLYYFTCDRLLEYKENKFGDGYFYEVYVQPLELFKEYFLLNCTWEINERLNQPA